MGQRHLSGRVSPCPVPKPLTSQGAPCWWVPWSRWLSPGGGKHWYTAPHTSFQTSPGLRDICSILHAPGRILGSECSRRNTPRAEQGPQRGILGRKDYSSWSEKDEVAAMGSSSVTRKCVRDMCGVRTKSSNAHAASARGKPMPIAEPWRVACLERSSGTGDQG